MSHRGEGNAVLVISQISHNLSVSLNNTDMAKNLKLMQVEHACSSHALSCVVLSVCFIGRVGIRVKMHYCSFGARVKPLLPSSAPRNKRGAY